MLTYASAPHTAIIDPRYWSDAEDNDRQVLLVGIRICLKIIRSEAMQRYLLPAPVDDDPTSFWWPYSSSNIDKITDEQLLKWMTRSSFTLYHPIGTARMGPDASKSVIDLKGNVHGVEGLRVCDASIFPEQVSGHPTAPVIAIAEKMADIIRGLTVTQSGASTSKANGKANGNGQHQARM
jgi:choline dehydrogenase